MIQHRSVWGKSSRSSSKMVHIKDVMSERKQEEAIQVGRLTIVPLLGTPVVDRIYGQVHSEIHLQETPYVGHLQIHNRGRLPVILPGQTQFRMVDGSVQATSETTLIGGDAQTCLSDASRTSIKDGVGDAIPAFSLLPFPLRNGALRLAGVRGSTKLWGDICQFFRQIGTSSQEDLGHFFQANSSFFEAHLNELYPKPHQTGAIFFWDGQWMGIELRSDEAHFLAEWQGIYLSYLSTLLLKPTQPDQPKPYVVNNQGFFTAPKEFKSTCLKKDGFNQLLQVAQAETKGEVVLHMGQPAFASVINSSLRWW